MQVGCWGLAGAGALSEAFIRIPLLDFHPTRPPGILLFHVEIVS